MLFVSRFTKETTKSQLRMKRHGDKRVKTFNTARHSEIHGRRKTESLIDLEDLSQELLVVSQWGGVGEDQLKWWRNTPRAAG